MGFYFNTGKTHKVCLMEQTILYNPDGMLMSMNIETNHIA